MICAVDVRDEIGIRHELAAFDCFPVENRRAGRHDHFKHGPKAGDRLTLGVHECRCRLSTRPQHDGRLCVSRVEHGRGAPTIPCVKKVDRVLLTLREPRNLKTAAEPLSRKAPPKQRPRINRQPADHQDLFGRFARFVRDPAGDRGRAFEFDAHIEGSGTWLGTDVCDRVSVVAPTARASVAELA